MTKTTAAQNRATKKYQDRVYDRFGITVPKGTKERIRAAAAIEGKTPNSWIGTTILKELENLGIAPATTDADRTDAQPDADKEK